MNEEIKFRAWSNVQMVTSDKYKSMADFWLDCNYCKIMQYTGLKDKNGKEIYEGDICKTYNYDEPSELFDTVVFDDGAFIFRSNDKLDATLRGFKTDYIEVIGNIYENSEYKTNQ